jgi:hypothetical protein
VTTTYEIARRNLESRIAAYSDSPISEQLDADRRGIAQLDCLIEEIRRAERVYCVEVCGETPFAYDGRVRDL